MSIRINWRLHKPEWDFIDQLVSSLRQTDESLREGLLGLFCAGSYFTKRRHFNRVPHDIDVLFLGAEYFEKGIFKVLDFTKALIQAIRDCPDVQGRPVFTVPRYEVLLATEAALSEEHAILVHLMPFASLKDLAEFHPRHITHQLIKDSMSIVPLPEGSLKQLEKQKYSDSEYPRAFLAQMLLETWIMLISDLGKHKYCIHQCAQRYRYVIDWLGLDSSAIEQEVTDTNKLLAGTEQLLLHISLQGKLELSGTLLECLSPRN